MTRAARKLLDEVLSLPEDERLAIATEIVASVATQPAWEEAWLGELVRRDEAHAARGQVSPEWSEVRARIFGKLSSR